MAARILVANDAQEILALFRMILKSIWKIDGSVLLYAY
jgi:hypothetical protein